MPDIASLKLLGLAGVVSYAAARLAAKAGMLGYSRLTLVAVPLSGMPEMPAGFRVAPLTAEQLRTIPIDVPAEIYDARFAQGMTCLGAYNRKDQLVGVTWLGSGAFEEDIVHIRFTVPTDAAWDAGLWIAPKYRLGRGFAALWAGTADWLRANGKSWSMSWIADYNLACLLSHKRMGAVTVGHVTTLRFIRWQYMAEGRPRLIRINGGNPAEMRVSPPDIHPAFTNIMS